MSLSNTPAAPTCSAPCTLPTILLCGDSLTQFAFDPSLHGWAASLSAKLIGRADILNRGASGYTSASYRALLPHLALPTHADALVVFLGANDAAVPGSTQHVPVAQYRTNLAAILAHLDAKYPTTRARIVVTPPGVYEPGVQKVFPHSIRTVVGIAQYAAAARAVASQSGWALADVFDATKDGAADLFIADGLHLARKGNDVVFDVVWRTLVVQWPDLGNEEKGFAWPYWATLPPAGKEGGRALVESLAAFAESRAADQS
ncbi:hypothetical protein AMAG_06088 [Allomyces macrogynus ATCC 38327]|uniref:SGNH hydrolase-type esterase domain-containing protein n=1 Tax=Allomyces macrogynus (strain ATCC 38327) TaxID=578462 RepID=A0A0L0SEB0_ALLM3|nr:hypothetical protein AMAG_06088 [Allomyces macrogynus ATCC 38327]|eukprot:KNE60725.1 hypothetical protein AMAG_06088 [Allomyces macrogynus ATCC 38327]